MRSRNEATERELGHVRLVLQEIRNWYVEFSELIDCLITCHLDELILEDFLVDELRFDQLPINLQSPEHWQQSPREANVSLETLLLFLRGLA